MIEHVQLIVCIQLPWVSCSNLIYKITIYWHMVSVQCFWYVSTAKRPSTVIECCVTNQVNILHLISLFMCVFIFFIDFPSSTVSTPTSTTRRIIMGASQFQNFVYFRCCCCFSISFDFGSLCFVSSGFCFWVCIFFSRFLGRNSLSALKVPILVFILVFLLRPKDLKKKYVNQVYSLTSGYRKDVLWLRKQ